MAGIRFRRTTREVRVPTTHVPRSPHAVAMSHGWRPAR